MTVHELIKILEKFYPDDKVYVKGPASLNGSVGSGFYTEAYEGEAYSVVDFNDYNGCKRNNFVRRGVCINGD